MASNIKPIDNVGKTKKKLNKRQRSIKNKVKRLKEKKNNKMNLCKTSPTKAMVVDHIKNLEKNVYDDVSTTIKNKSVKKSKLDSLTKKQKHYKSPGIEENKFKKVKTIYKVKDPEDFSANWKNLKETISAKDKPRPKLQTRPKTTYQIKKAEKPEALKEENKDEDEIWFDDVDPSLLEDSTLKSNMKSNQEGLHVNISKCSSLKIDDSFSGVTKAVGLDCEMVGGGISGEENILARVSIVNHFGNVLYDKYVKAMEPILDYRTEFSGIRPKDLVNAESYVVVQKEVHDLIKDRIVVGHALSNDFKCLLLSHPKYLVRDTSRYKPFIKQVGGGRPSLKKLAENILGTIIQSGEHDSVQDAQAAMRLYTLNKNEWEKAIALKKRMGMRKRKREDRKQQSDEEDCND